MIEGLFSLPRNRTLACCVAELGMAYCWLIAGTKTSGQMQKEINDIE